VRGSPTRKRMRVSDPRSNRSNVVTYP
jgi:hypothetical protein